MTHRQYAGLVALAIPSLFAADAPKTEPPKPPEMVEAPPLSDKQLRIVSGAHNDFIVGKERGEELKKQIDAQVQQLLQTYQQSIQSAQKESGVPSNCGLDNHWNWKVQTGPDQSGPCMVPKPVTQPTKQEKK